MSAKAPTKSLAQEAAAMLRAVKLLKLGARIQVIEAELPGLSRERLIRLYREVNDRPPPKGMLPFSSDWYLSWRPNIHVSMFANVYAYLEENDKTLDRIDLLTGAYGLYSEHFVLQNKTLELDLTRAWTFVRFKNAGMLSLKRCARCLGKFVVHTGDSRHGFVCGICRPPSRAGKTRR